jgi:ATP-dependent DNA helicase Rep
MLNYEQMAAVHYIDGPLLVLAGAGSGKTRVITHKIAYLIKQCGYAANTVYAVTFTNKAAHEMRERVMSVLPPKDRRGLKVATFHALGLMILKRDLAVLGLKPGFSLFDSEDSLHLLKGLLPEGQAQDREVILTLQRQISRWKNDMLGPEDVHLQPVVASADAVGLYARYQQALQAYNAIDFDDLIRLPVHLLKIHPDIREYWQNKIRYLLIDEYQDSNTCQYVLMRLLTGIRSQFTVVGDDDQSIYAWRGARPENLAELHQDYPQLKVIKLEQNYRSTGRILHAANMLIQNNPHLFHKKLWSAFGHGDLLRVLSCMDEQAEAEQVVMDLMSHKLRFGKSFGDYAILYRGNHQSRVFEKVLRDHGIAYQISGGQSWFAKKEVKDVFAYLKLLCNPADDAAFLRVINTPKRGIGDVTLEALARYSQSRAQSLYTCCCHMALSEWIGDKPRHILQAFKHWFEGLKSRIGQVPILTVLREMLDESGYEAYLYEQSDTPIKAQKGMDNVFELLTWVSTLMEKEAQTQLAEVINKLILIDLLEKTDEQAADTVQLMTLHASKGLEFPFVYLVGMEEEILPHRVSIEEEQIEEERRLAYVGMTRAQKGLCMTLARKRRREGEWQESHPSRFLEELPQDSLEWFGRDAPDEARSKALAQSHLSGLKQLLQTLEK